MPRASASHGPLLRSHEYPIRSQFQIWFRDIPGPRRIDDRRHIQSSRAYRHSRHESIGAEGVRHRQRPRSAGLFPGRPPCSGCRFRLPLRPQHHPRHPRRLCPQPPRHGHRLPRHRQVDPYRAGRRPAELALRARQPRQPHQPHRPGRQGFHRGPRRQAGHRIPRRHPAVGAAAQHRAGVRRI